VIAAVSLSGCKQTPAGGTCYLDAERSGSLIQDRPSASPPVAGSSFLGRFPLATQAHGPHVSTGGKSPGMGPGDRGRWE
jgi:hypothetical protein